MDPARLRYMADQIARNFAAIGHDDAVAATADHIVKFWDPRMKAAIIAGDPAALSPVAGEAVALLAKRVQPLPNHATVLGNTNGGEKSDAG